MKLFTGHRPVRLNVKRWKTQGDIIVRGESLQHANAYMSQRDRFGLMASRSIFPIGSKASTCYLNVLHTFELILNCCAVAAVPFVTPANDRSIFQYRSKSPKSTFNLRNALELISNCRTVTATVRVTPGNDWSPTLNKHNHCSPQRHTILLLHFLLVSVAAVRKDIRPEETCTFRSPTLTKHNHCSPQRHTKLQFDFLLCS